MNFIYVVHMPYWNHLIAFKKLYNSSNSSGKPPQETQPNPPQDWEPRDGAGEPQVNQGTGPTNHR